jgi:hypothetical protein
MLDTDVSAKTRMHSTIRIVVTALVFANHIKPTFVQCQNWQITRPVALTAVNAYPPQI